MEADMRDRMRSAALAAIVSTAAGRFALADTVRIGVGTQDTTINCAAGGPVVRELNLLPKYLPHEGRYANVTYDIVWKNFTSGPPLGTEMLAGKLDIGQMADFPAVLTATAFANSPAGVRLLYVSSLSGGVNGAGNAILVPIASSVQSIRDLKGKKISVPFGSTAHAMLLRAIEDQGWDPETDVTLISQAPEVGGSALKSGQVDAHADFVPFGELFPFRGIARKVYDGSSTGVTTTHGVVVRADFASKYPELVVAYLKATLEADRLLREQPEELSEKIALWTGVDAEVVYAFHGPRGIQTRDFTLKPEFRQAIARAVKTLRILKKVDSEIDAREFVDDQFIRRAAAEAGLDYEARLKSYDPLPLSGGDFETHKPVTDPRSAGQVWVKGEGKLRLYSSPRATLRALQALDAAGTPARVAFVHDRETGLKLFANLAWYVEDSGGWSAFLQRDAAEGHARQGNGKVAGFEEAKAAAAAARRAEAWR
jgi:NitT/TauT family transport system substrate-binding protein